MDMSICLIYFLLLLSSALSRNVPRYSELDEEDQHLFRAAYDAPSYSDDQYEDNDLPLGKLDLVKDGLWAVKAKIKEMKAFDKAMAANLLSTKLQLKDFLKNHLLQLKKHHHEAKPSYSYHAPTHQAPQYQQYEPQHAPPLYQAPILQYPQYQAPVPQYQATLPQYQDQAPQYGHDPYYGH